MALLTLVYLGLISILILDHEFLSLFWELCCLFLFLNWGIGIFIFPFTKHKSWEFEIRAALSLLWFETSDFPWYVSLEIMSSSKAGAIINNLPWPLSSVSLRTFPRASGISFVKWLNMDLISDKKATYMTLVFILFAWIISNICLISL